MQRPPKSPVDNTAPIDCSDLTWQQRYPAISEYMLSVTWDDGSPRKPSSLSIRFGSDGVVVSLQDQELKQGAYTTAETVDEALTLLNDAIAAGKCRWLRWNSGKRS